MDTTFKVEYVFHELTLGGGYNLRNIYNALSENITGAISDTVIPARVDEDLFGQQHSIHGPWMNAGTWFYFDPVKSAYLPVKILVGSVVVEASPTADRIQFLQDKSGTVALLDDVYAVRDTLVLPEGTTMVDWDKSTFFKCTLSKDRKTYFHMAHSRQGMKIKLLVVNSGGNQTVLWDSLINWPNNTPPTMPASQTGSAKSLLVTLRNINNTIYGDSQVQEHSSDLPIESLHFKPVGVTPPSGTYPAHP